MIRPGYPQRPLGPGGVIPALQRPPIMPMRGPVIPTIIRPPINLNIAPVEKPMTTIYVGKIASTVDNDFMLSLLQVTLLPPVLFAVLETDFSSRGLTLLNVYRSYVGLLKVGNVYPIPLQERWRALGFVNLNPWKEYYVLYDCWVNWVLMVKSLWYGWIFFYSSSFRYIFSHFLCHVKKLYLMDLRH